MLHFLTAYVFRIRRTAFVRNGRMFLSPQYDAMTNNRHIYNHPPTKNLAGGFRFFDLSIET